MNAWRFGPAKSRSDGSSVCQSIVEGFNPAGLRNYWKTSYVNELSAEAIDLLIERYQSVPSPQSHVVLYTLGGAVGRAADEATAVSYRNARHIALIVGMWADREADEMNLRWIRECHAAVQPFTTTGFYVNYEADAAADRIQDAYGAGKFQRLASIKAKYDPNNCPTWSNRDGPFCGQLSESTIAHDANNSLDEVELG